MHSDPHMPVYTSVNNKIIQHQLAGGILIRVVAVRLFFLKKLAGDAYLGDESRYSLLILESLKSLRNNFVSTTSFVKIYKF